MKAKDFDKLFDEGQDITKYLEKSKIVRPGEKTKRVNVDFPVWMITELNKEAKRLGVPRQSVIKFWIAEKMEKYKSH
ncbi:MAG: type II toxin-antitoxin system BrnA family antitoxin [Bacillota bacterium]